MLNKSGIEQGKKEKKEKAAFTDPTHCHHMNLVSFSFLFPLFSSSFFGPVLTASGRMTEPYILPPGAAQKRRFRNLIIRYGLTSCGTHLQPREPWEQ